jgi:hypothetical protein
MASVKTQKDQDSEMASAAVIGAGRKKLHFAGLGIEDLKKANGVFGGVFSDLEKSAINTVSAIRAGEEFVPLTFAEDPTQHTYTGIYKQRVGLMPDGLLKTIAKADDLVAAILHARSNQIGTFGRELQDRFNTGFRIEPREGIMDDMDPSAKKEFQKKIEKAAKLLATCGHTQGVPKERQQSLSRYLYLQARNGILFGRFATEIGRIKDSDGKQKFHSFKAVDAGTIYQAVPREDSYGKSVRAEAIKLLEKEFGQKLLKDSVEKSDYDWYQVINNKPVQGYTTDEMYVHNMFPTTDVELGGYPLTPLDCAMQAVMMHMNISTMNRLYFQNGRAARGMIIIQSEDTDQGFVEAIKQHFHATANGVDKAFRVPVFGIGKDDTITWQPIELQGGRDMEFQYLCDQNSRVLLSAFQMSPEELPGYQHLARGTNNQGLSESNNEYKLEAARDIGIRPLLAQFQDFINSHLMPLIDPDVAKLCVLKLYGLDSDSPEREATRLQQDIPIHMTQDQVQVKVEKEPYGKEWGGEYPLSPAYQAVIEKYFTVGEILEHYMGRKGAAKDPSLAYIRDEYWFNYQQMLQQVQAAQQQAQNPQQPPAGGAPPGGGSSPGGNQQPPQGDQQQSGQPGQLGASADQATQALSKSESQLALEHQRILSQHRSTVASVLKSWKADAKKAAAELNKITKKRD